MSAPGFHPLQALWQARKRRPGLAACLLSPPPSPSSFLGFSPKFASLLAFPSFSLFFFSSESLVFFPLVNEQWFRGGISSLMAVAGSPNYYRAPLFSSFGGLQVGWQYVLGIHSPKKIAQKRGHMGSTPKN